MNSELLNQAIRRAQWAKYSPTTPELVKADAEQQIIEAVKPLNGRIKELIEESGRLQVEIKTRDDIIPRLMQRIRDLENEIVAAPGSQPTQITGRMIIDAVGAAWMVPYTDMVSVRRKHPIAHARQVAAYLMRNLTSLTFPQIARMLGGRDHTTIMHGVSSVAARRTAYPDLDAKINQIEQQLRAAMETEL